MAKQKVKNISSLDHTRLPFSHPSGTLNTLDSIKKERMIKSIALIAILILIGCGKSKSDTGIDDSGCENSNSHSR